MNKKALLIIGLMIGCIGSLAQADHWGWGGGWGWGGPGWGWGGYPYGYGYGPEAAAVYGATGIIGGAIAGHQERKIAEAHAAAAEARAHEAEVKSGKYAPEEEKPEESEEGYYGRYPKSGY